VCLSKHNESKKLKLKFQQIQTLISVLVQDNMTFINNLFSMLRRIQIHSSDLFVIDFQLINQIRSDLVNTMLEHLNLIIWSTKDLLLLLQKRSESKSKKLMKHQDLGNIKIQRLLWMNWWKSQVGRKEHLVVKK